MLNRANPAADPLEKFQRWYSEAQPGNRRGGLMAYPVSAVYGLLRRTLSLAFQSANLFRPDVATFATVASDNTPSARSVLFKGIVEGGFSFYTDYESDKGKELDANPSATMVFYWSLPPRQVRIDGKVEKLSRAYALKDWQGRTRENQAASAAVRQSIIISGREELEEKKRLIEHTYESTPIPCPESWGGYTLVPNKIEFWQGRYDWLHDRERYILNKERWERVQLAG
jgi:pyridoxamine 5'-phosphate oxidase